MNLVILCKDLTNSFMKSLKYISNLLLFFLCFGYSAGLFGQTRNSKPSTTNNGVKREIAKTDKTLDQTGETLDDANDTFDKAANTVDKAKGTFDKIKTTFKPNEQNVSEKSAVKPKGQNVSDSEGRVSSYSENESVGLIIKIRGFEYDDEHVTSLISELEKMSGVGEVSYKYKSDISTLEVASNLGEKLWGKIPADVKKSFTVVEIGDGIVDLRKRKK